MAMTKPLNNKKKKEAEEELYSDVISIPQFLQKRLYCIRSQID